MNRSFKRMLLHSMKTIVPLTTLFTCTVLVSGSTLSSATNVADSTQSASAANVSGEVSLNLNGQPIQYRTPPRLIDNTLMVPLNDLSESLGVQMEWNESTQTAVATKADFSIKLVSGQAGATRQGESVTLDVAPQMENGQLLVPLRFFSESFDYHVYWDAPSRSVSVWDADKSLPTVGSFDRLLKLVEGSSYAGMGVSVTVKAEAAVSVTDRSAAKEKQSAGSAPAAPATASAESKPAYSKTNVQVEGVDEADIIKTDGSYIYQVNRNRVIVTKAAPADQMSVVNTIAFDDKHFRPAELYIDEKQMIVIGSTVFPQEAANIKPQAGDASASVAAVPSGESAVTTKEKKIISPALNRPAMKAIVYELNNRSDMNKVREIELDGRYVSSRKIGDSLYLIANKGMSLAPLRNDAATAAEKEAAVQRSLPSYKDSAIGGASIPIGLEDIRYFPQAVVPDYLIVAGLRVGEPNSKMNVTGYLGSGNQVYASLQNLYIAAGQYERTPVPLKDTAKPAVVMPQELSTAVYKFALDAGNVTYSGRGKVPGRALNQFSMDEHEGYFRIATTKGEIWRNDEHTSKNNLYVLDKSMQTVGKIEDIAPGEQIYSVRYAGNRAYMVTFRTVDPLFVIDLKKPEAPSILGKLKIPGYSNYLHPYDDNHIIGFGKDTIEVSGGGSGETVGLYQGMKMALFDVTDVTQPKELFVETIGGRGTESELLHNHKALLFSKEDGLLAFPVRVLENKQQSNASSMKDAMRTGDFTFQGAYVYKLDLTGGFRLQGKITHWTDEDYAKAGQYGGFNGRNIERILYIGETLYTSSQQMLKATHKTTFQELGTVAIP